MTISVEELGYNLEQAADDGIVIIRYNGTVLYADSIEIKDGDVIISSDEKEDDDDF